MKHRINYRKLSRPTPQRLSLLRNLVTSLIKYDRITTTVPKAKELRRLADKMVTLAKKGHENAKKAALGILYESSLISKLFGPMAERYKDRQGGYTRILRTGERFGDKAEMAIIEYVDSPNQIGLATTVRKMKKLSDQMRNSSLSSSLSYSTSKEPSISPQI
jgi:large subunit ribosomal protein L17